MKSVRFLIVACMTVSLGVAAGCRSMFKEMGGIDPRTVIKASWGPLGGSVKIENDKDVTVIGADLGYDKINKCITFGKLEIHDKASPVMTANTNQMVAGGFNMPNLMAHRHQQALDADMLLNSTFDGLDGLLTFWQPYIQAKAKATEVDAVRGSLASQVLQAVMAKVLNPAKVEEITVADPPLGAEIAKQASAMKQAAVQLPASAPSVTQTQKPPNGANTLDPGG